MGVKSHRLFYVKNMNDIWLKLGDLDGEIYYLREHELKFSNPYSDEYKDIIKRYNELCEERRLLEESID